MFKKLIDFVCCKLLYHVKYIHLENLQKVPKYIICPNHSSIFDPTFIYPIVDSLATMAKAELFKNPILARIFRALGAFPVNREIKDTKSVLQALSVLEEKKESKLLLFPEGKTIRKDEPIGKVRNGAAFFAAKLEIPIIPVYITRFPKFFSKVFVVFGEPINISQEVLKDKEKMREESQMLLYKIYELEKEIVNEGGKK